MSTVTQSMAILMQSRVQADPGLLDRAWTDEASFALLPEPCNWSSDQLDAAFAQLPDALRTGHFLVSTSGTTGIPRLVVGRCDRAENLARLLHYMQESQPVRETIVALPLSYTYALVNQWVWSHCHDRRLVMTDGFAQPDLLGRALQKANDAMLCLVGIQLPLMARYFENRTFPGVIRVHFAGGRFPQERMDQVRSLFPNATIFNNYGCTEAMPRLTLRKAEQSPEASNVGAPLPGIELKTAPDGGLVFRSPYSAVGYLDAGGFHEIRPDDWTPTGDCAECNPDGSYRLTGRTGEIFKRHGEKVSISSLASTVHARWSGQAAFYREQDRSGEDGCVLTLCPTPRPEQLRSVLAGFAAEHPRASWPLRIESLDRMPLLANGKPDVLALSAQGERQVHWYQRV